MFSLDELSISFGRTLPITLQTEVTECGLACLAMVAGFHGHHIDLMTLRRRFPISLKGATLSDVIKIAQKINMNTRPLKLELENLSQLKLPCILHWNFNHFVVLKEVRPKSVIIHDPAIGVRNMSWGEVSASFTGVALEMWPGTDFKLQETAPTIGLGQLTGQITGLHRSIGQILMLALALEILGLVSPFFLQWVIDNVLVTADRDLLTTLAIGFGLLILIQQTVSAIRTWVILYMGTTLNIQWRANVFTHLTSLPVQYFEKRHLGDVVSRFSAIDFIQRTLTTSFLEVILDGLMTVATLALMFFYSPALGAIAVTAMAIYAISRWAWYGPLRNATDAQIIHSAKQQTHFLETVRGIKTIKLFQRQEQRRSTWLTLLVEQINADIRIQKLQLAYKLLNGLVFGIEGVLIIWLGAGLVLDGNFSVGALTAFIAYKSQFGTRASALVDKFYELKMLRLQGIRLADIVLSEPEAVPHRETIPDYKKSASIAVSQLCFRYSEREPLILDNVTFTIEAGESVAIVGPSGCGKSTLMNIILGILPLDMGEISIGGQSVKNCGNDFARSIIGTVLQDDVLFAGSIADNIHFFDPLVDQTWVENCAMMASISEEINAMPMGYQTLVGDMGTILSGGQKQRVLLARALYKRPKILFLDEATSHLDVKKEQSVNQAIKSLNMTRVIIAHRPETITSATRVLYLADGKIHQNYKSSIIKSA